MGNYLEEGGDYASREDSQKEASPIYVNEPLILEQPFIGKKIVSRYETLTSKANKENSGKRVNCLVEERGNEQRIS